MKSYMNLAGSLDLSRSQDGAASLYAQSASFYAWIASIYALFASLYA